MRVGMGLPAAVPGVDATVIGPWAAASERAGFTSLGVIDRLVYDNLDPLVALAAAAACTERIELLTTVLNVGYRRNPIVLAKQIASVDRLCGARLTVGLALGGWPEDYAASEAPLSGCGATFDATLVAMRQVWSGAMCGAVVRYAGAQGRHRIGARRLERAPAARGIPALWWSDTSRLATVPTRSPTTTSWSRERVRDELQRLADAVTDLFKTNQNRFGTNEI